MKLASVTLTSSREVIVRDAIESVKDFIDFAVVVDIGITDNTIGVFREILGEDRVKVIKSDLSIPTGELRNIGNQFALECGADWAITLDTDERINAKGMDVREMLENVKADILLVECDTGSHATYHKERFFKLPMKDRFERHIHECVVPKNSVVGRVEGMTFTELPKDPKAFKEKMQFIVDGLEKEIETNPNESRVWFYLADAYYGQERWDDALKAFHRCASLKGWNEEAAWACLRMATIFERQGKFEDAIDCCAVGLARHAGMPELAFYAGVLNLGLGRIEQAIYWCRMAIPNGKLGGEREVRPRMAWKIDYAMTKGPWEILRDGYKALGWADEELKCIRMLEPMAQ